MIFLSHNFKDKPVVEQVALKLRDVFGQENVFYDSWSIQPGDGIIDKMESGLSSCKFFFYFVSRNSLNSNMVKLEWQNALYKATNHSIKFIPVRLDGSELPSLLMQSLYIDLFTNGLEVAIRQIIDVINGANTFRPNQSFSNLVAYKSIVGNKIIIECRALHYLEPISYFAFCTQTAPTNLRVTLPKENMCMSNQMVGARLDNGHVTNIIFRGIERGTLPSFPFIIEFSSIDGSGFDIEAVLHKTSHELYAPIPLLNR